MGTDVLPKFPACFVLDQARNSTRAIFCSSWHLLALALAPATVQTRGRCCSETQGRARWNFLHPEKKKKKALNHVPEFVLVLTGILHPGFGHWGVFF